MLSLSGYLVGSKIYESANSLVYRGVRELDLQPLVFKALKPDYPTPDELTRYQQEHEITRSLSLEGVIQVYGIETYQNTLVMFLEDFAGESLAYWLTQRALTLTEALTLGIQITEILGQVHQQQVIHKDINPSNIVWNPTTGQLKLIDFGIASRITRETPTLRNPDILEGTLAYMSPEQTGRMNRSIDYRTDFYSLGMTLYELLTQQLPFTADDALELVHCHLAKNPVSPSDRLSTIPQPVSAIVMKLLAKTAEDRYQSCRGIQSDLETCLTQLQTTQEVAAFPLARYDSSETFQIPQKLYGRNQEVEALLAAFERVVGAGNRKGEEIEDKEWGNLASNIVSPQSELMLISGYSGIGKTSLVQEIYKPITQQRGYVITGKFDQYQRNIPYSAFVNAFSGWVEQLLTEPETQLNDWRSQLLSALEPNTQVMVDVIPELALVLGPQPPVPELPPTETRNRFNRVLQQFIQVLAQPHHPLVIFLDDLQWVDAASLQLIQVLTTTKVPFLFLIGAYRDNEVSATHPLTQAIAEMQSAGIPIQAIALSPLQKLDIQHLLVDTLNRSMEEVAPLADLVLTKTNGNPFFVNEFLRALYVEQLLIFDYQNNQWKWAIAEIQQRNITDNVVELLVTKIQRLQQNSQAGLRYAACIGNQFDLQTLTFVLQSAGVLQEADAVRAIALLKAAVNMGLIIPLNDSYKRIELGIPKLGDALRMEYKFAHDRIQQAAYSLNSVAERPAIHWQIGQKILQHTPPEQREQHIFDIVNHLNIGVELAPSVERQELVRLNLIAAQKAKASAAFSATMQYLKTALALLPQDSWHTEYYLTLALYTLAAEAAYLNGDLEQTEQFAATVLKHAQSLPDKVKIYEVQIQAYGSQMQFLAALQIGLKTLEELGVILPVSPTAAEIESAFGETAAMLADRQIQTLIDLPPMTDAIAIQSLRILTHLLAPSYQAAPPLFPLLILKMVNLSVEYGNHELSAFAYAAYANILNCVVLDLDQSYQFVELGLHLLAQFPNSLLRCKTLFMANCSVRFCKVHLRETIQPLQEAYQLGIESGDIEFAGYSILHHCDHCFFVGMPLAEVQHKITDYVEALTQLKESTNTNALQVYQQTIANLTQSTLNPTLLVGEAYNESQELPLLQQANHHKGLFYLYFNKLLLSCYFQDADRAVENANQANRYPEGGRSNAVFPIFYFYDSLARLMQYPTASPEVQSAILQRITKNQEKMQLWAYHAPTNNLHRWHLIEAERYQVLGEDAEAIANYDRAVDLAKEHGYIHEQALAYERTALFYLERGKEILARAYLQEAQYCYLRWGAMAKVDALEARYPNLFQHRSASTGVNLNVSLTTTNSSHAETLDLATVVKASRVLSGELNLEKLLEQLMTLVLQNAGAQAATLLLQTNQHFRIEATGTVDPIEVIVHSSIPLEDTDQLPISLIQYVLRKQKTIILEDATREMRFASDRYIQSQKPKSVLCTPIQGHGKLTGILYLENNLTTDAFTLDRAVILQVLTAQAAIALENARLYEQLEIYSQTLEANNYALQQEVSDRRRAEEQLRHSLSEREVLLKEIHHRVKNNLQIISGLLQLQAQSVTDTAATNILRESQHRIESMSLIHKKLYASSDFGEIDLSDYIPSLASNLITSYQLGPGHVNLHMDIARVLLNIDQAIPCGLIVNELISNALKYAFPGDRTGEIQIYLPSPSHQQIELTIRDNGVGLPETVDWKYSQSLGLSLVHDLVVEQLEGSLTVERDHGTTFRIKFPQAALLNPN
ncbi:AAA family ATPase [Leptolyngbya sp. FACHB-541]|uniref:AAA family ATPase n=1 Tax=Leptolyngbya sp. FACHB-541 TaxID=2692810 RepID=UPI0016867722|nr:AAA family ATPase [Leptolyngbya sp. FACHB-541]MBD1997791.1 AAA family ATPase [Leptolyngbya sp. FACHB-541]